MMVVFLSNCRKSVNEPKPVQRTLSWKKKKKPPLLLLLCLLLRSLSASIGENFNYSQNYWKAIFLNSLYPCTAEQTWCPPSMTCQLIFTHRCVKNAAESWTLSSVFLLVKQWASEEDGDGASGKREREKKGWIISVCEPLSSFSLRSSGGLCSSFHLNWFSFKWTKQGGKDKNQMQKQEN